MSILLIDDDVDVKESTQVMLMDEGYTVNLACDGMQGIEAYEKTHPEITFLDIKMPGIDGYETFNKIIKIDPKAKVAFITGFATDPDKLTNAQKNDLIATLQKPVELRDLLKIIKKHS